MNKKKLILIIGTILFITTSIILNIKKVALSGLSIYKEKSLIIDPIYYSVIGFLALLFFFVLTFKKEDKKSLKSEVNELLMKDKIKKDKTPEVKNDSEESIPEVDSPISQDPDIKEEIRKEEEDDDDNEVFKKGEEKLEDEIKKEVKEENKKNVDK